jgi:hypothetical protein
MFEGVFVAKDPRIGLAREKKYREIGVTITKPHITETMRTFMDIIGYFVEVGYYRIQGMLLRVFRKNHMG